MTLQHLTPPAPRPPADRSPLDQRHDLGKRLRALRLQAGLTGVQLAERLDCHSSKISRIEHGNAIPSPADVRAWCMATGHDDQADDLAAQAANVEAAYTAWRSVQRTGLLQLQEASRDLFARTHRIQTYESRVIPGLLQTLAYSAEVLAQTRARRGSPDDVAAAAAARNELRRRTLDDAKTLAFVIEEHVLRSPVVPPEVMREQAEQLIADSRRPNMSIGVIPIGPRKRWATECFTIFDGELVRTQLVSGRFAAAAPGDVAEYRTVFEELSALAVYGDGARELIRAPSA